jgi:tetratricopeptide (TPR) repeat protein
MDFQKLIVLEPKNPMVHIYAGNLLMTTGSYEDATKAFTNADNIHKSPLALYQRSRCHVALNQMSEALKDLNRVIEQSPTDKVAIADKECLSALKLAAGGGQPFERQVYEKAAVMLTKLISNEKNEHLAKINHDSSVLYQHSQVIPSAQRTKTDKVRAIRRRREQDRIMKQKGGPPADNALLKNDLRFRV